MPDKDGYEVCQYIKQHPKFATTPVILMSGVVNKSVAEKAFSVKADELIRKPFQPQDLIARVRHLLRPAPAVPPPSPAVANAALSSIFGAAAAAAAAAAPVANGGQTIARRIPAPLGLGAISLSDGANVLGFLCEAYATEQARDVTSAGSWRAYLKASG